MTAAQTLVPATIKSRGTVTAAATTVLPLEETGDEPQSTRTGWQS